MTFIHFYELPYKSASALMSYNIDNDQWTQLLIFQDALENWLGYGKLMYIYDKLSYINENGSYLQLSWHVASWNVVKKFEVNQSIVTVIPYYV